MFSFLSLVHWFWFLLVSPVKSGAHLLQLLGDNIMSRNGFSSPFLLKLLSQDKTMIYFAYSLI